MTSLIQIIATIGWLAVIYYQLRKFKSTHSKSAYTSFMKTVGVSGMVGYVAFFGLAAILAWVNQTAPDLKSLSVTSVVGLILGLLMGMFIDGRIRNKNTPEPQRKIPDKPE